MSKRPLPPIEEMLKAIQEAGYEVKQPRQYIKHTFEVEKPVLEEFKATLQQHKYKIKEAINEALRLWIRSKRG